MLNIFNQFLWKSSFLPILYLTDMINHNVPMEECIPANQLFMCKDEVGCLDINQVCDGISHCLDDSDEGSLCSGMRSCMASNFNHFSNVFSFDILESYWFLTQLRNFLSESCDKLNCSTHQCYRTPSGPVCNCPKGTRMENGSCVGKFNQFIFLVRLSRLVLIGFICRF